MEMLPSKKVIKEYTENNNTPFSMILASYSDGSLKGYLKGHGFRVKKVQALSFVKDTIFLNMLLKLDNDEVRINANPYIVEVSVNDKHFQVEYNAVGLKYTDNMIYKIKKNILEYDYDAIVPAVDYTLNKSDDGNYYANINDFFGEEDYMESFKKVYEQLTDNQLIIVHDKVYLEDALLFFRYNEKLLMEYLSLEDGFFSIDTNYLAWSYKKEEELTTKEKNIFEEKINEAISKGINLKVEDFNEKFKKPSHKADKYVIPIVSVILYVVFLIIGIIPLNTHKIENVYNESITYKGIENNYVLNVEDIEITVTDNVIRALNKTNFESLVKDGDKITVYLVGSNDLVGIKKGQNEILDYHSVIESTINNSYLVIGISTGVFIIAVIVMVSYGYGHGIIGKRRKEDNASKN